MKRLRIIILIFAVALAVPLCYLVQRTQQSLEQEETAELRFFADALFDRMEQELAELVQREEQRPVDDYLAPSPAAEDGLKEGAGLAPVRNEIEPYILGYLQNNPHGSFTAPLMGGGGAELRDRTAVVKRFEEVNRILNSKHNFAPEGPERQASMAAQPTVPPQKKSATERKDLPADKEEDAGFAARYLDFSRSSKQKLQLGQAEKRVEQISPKQAMNLAKLDEEQEGGASRAKTAPQGKMGQDGDAAESRARSPQPAAPRGTRADSSYAGAPPSVESLPRSGPAETTGSTGHPTSGKPASLSAPTAASEREPHPARAQTASPVAAEAGLRVEVDPLQSVHIDQSLVLLFRRVVIGNQVYRQGMVIEVEELLRQLEQKHFAGQPIARFAALTLTSTSGGRDMARIQEGQEIGQPRFILERTFPRPFAFVRARLACEAIPRSPGHATLYIMAGVTAMVILLGLLAIYQSARIVMELSERRSGFVSSVTHELKTPLTNIRMYIEMLEQGIASNPERELEYYRIVQSESARLSRLINNVLEFSKLEKRQRRLDLREGSLEDVLAEVCDAVQEWLRKEGFTLTVENLLGRPFRYDREVMVQVLMNLIENSVKFGRNGSRREISVRMHYEGDRAVVRVSDTGPGIPRHALRKVFDDFYRAEDHLTRTTKGTGIGLALVKRFVETMGGRVFAANNDGAGCTITILLPEARSRQTSNC